MPKVYLFLLVTQMFTQTLSLNHIIFILFLQQWKKIEYLQAKIHFSFEKDKIWDYVCCFHDLKRAQQEKHSKSHQISLNFVFAACNIILKEIGLKMYRPIIVLTLWYMWLIFFHTFQKYATVRNGYIAQIHNFNWGNFSECAKIRKYHQIPFYSLSQWDLYQQKSTFKARWSNKTFVPTLSKIFDLANITVRKSILEDGKQEQQKKFQKQPLISFEATIQPRALPLNRASFLAGL